MRRSADAIKAPTYVEDKDLEASCAVRTISISKTGMYKGRQILKPKKDA